MCKITTTTLVYVSLIVLGNTVGVFCVAGFLRPDHIIIWVGLITTV